MIDITLDKLFIAGAWLPDGSLRSHHIFALDEQDALLSMSAAYPDGSADSLFAVPAIEHFRWIDSLEGHPRRREAILSCAIWQEPDGALAFESATSFAPGEGDRQLLEARPGSTPLLSFSIPLEAAEELRDRTREALAAGAFLISDDLLALSEAGLSTDSSIPKA